MRCTTRIFFLLLLFNLIQPGVSYAQSPDHNDWVWSAIHAAAFNHSLSVPKKKITIAVIDDGFDLANPLWKDCIIKNTKEIPGNKIDDDNNGKTDDVAGWDFADNDNDVIPHPTGEDKLTHGTAVLGILWQALNKLFINEDAYISILPLKAKSDYSTNNYITEGYRAIEYATAQHADIIVCCWSGGIFDEPKQKILEDALKQNICIVASAGNFSARREEYPGAFPAVINVTGVNRQLQKQRACNYGPFVDVAAPADSIATYMPGNNDIAVKMNGSSACTPIVAAAIALLKTARPTIAVFDIDRLLKQSAEPLEPYNNHYKGELGAGLLNIENLFSLIASSSNSTAVYLQPKSFIKITDLDKKEIHIKPGGTYKHINFFATTQTKTGKVNANLPSIHFRYYFKDNLHDTLIKGNALLYPLNLPADSVTVTLKNKNAPIPANYYLYYEAVTIDSSCLYCNGIKNIIASSGNIEDGSGDEKYTGFNDCKWLIEGPVGKRIKINFTAFETEAKKDFVYIFNGTSTNTPVLAMFSGSDIPPTVTSRGNKVLIWFLTEEFSFGKGWNLHFEAVE